MEMRHLTEIGRWLLSQPNLKTKFGEPLWREVFDACGSPQEWEALVSRRRAEPLLRDLWAEAQAIRKLQGPPPQFSKPVDLPTEPF